MGDVHHVVGRDVGHLDDMGRRKGRQPQPRVRFLETADLGVEGAHDVQLGLFLGAGLPGRPQPQATATNAGDTEPVQRSGGTLLAAQQIHADAVLDAHAGHHRFALADPFTDLGVSQHDVDLLQAGLDPFNHVDIALLPGFGQ
jgi:hypothetical protein